MNGKAKFIIRRTPLNDEIWQPYIGNELSGLLAVTKRMLAYWETTWIDPFVIVVPSDDQGLYDTLITDFHFLLKRSPLDQTEIDQITSLIPGQFMDSDLALAIDHDMTGDIRDSFVSAMSVIRRASYRLGTPCQESDPTSLFSLFDPEIRKHLEHNRESTARHRKRFPELNPISQLDQLKVDVANIERRLRSLIANTINDDWSVIPDHIRAKADDRINAVVRENPVVDRTQFNSASGRLAYCDLRELEQIIVSKSHWTMFADAFGTKEMVNIRFRQLAPLRNANAHLREVDELVRSDAATAVIWFKGALSRAGSLNESEPMDLPMQETAEKEIHAVPIKEPDIHDPVS